MQHRISKNAFEGKEMDQDTMRRFLEQDLKNISSLTYLIMTEPEVKSAVVAALMRVYRENQEKLKPVLADGK